MTYTFNIKNIPTLTRKLYNVNIYVYKNKLANVNFNIYNDNNKNIATINNLEVYDLYKRQGYGSKILNNVENYIKYKHNVENVNLLAWQQQGNSNICEFFEKNGYNYCEQNENIPIYDDSIHIYDLYKMNKNL